MHNMTTLVVYILILVAASSIEQNQPLVAAITEAKTSPEIVPKNRVFFKITLAKVA